MSNINTHRGVDRKWEAYKYGHNPFTLTFTESAVAVDLSSYVFVCNIKRQKGVTENVLQLTEGSGIVNGGATGIITVTLTKENIETYLPASDYFYEIKYTVGGFEYPLIQGGLALLHNNPSSTATGVNITVNMEGVNVAVAVTLGGGGGITTPEELIAILEESTEAETLAILDLLRPARYDDETIVFYDDDTTVAYDNF
jgi:hypothetical protein